MGELTSGHGLYADHFLMDREIGDAYFLLTSYAPTDSGGRHSSFICIGDNLLCTGHIDRQDNVFLFVCLLVC